MGLGQRPHRLSDMYRGRDSGEDKYTKINRGRRGVEV
jgi:hypothetical protein